MTKRYIDYIDTDLQQANEKYNPLNILNVWQNKKMMLESKCNVNNVVSFLNERKKIKKGDKNDKKCEILTKLLKKLKSWQND